MNIRNKKSLCGYGLKGRCILAQGNALGLKIAPSDFALKGQYNCDARDRRRAGGFSLTEMLIATGIMAVGLVMIATIFPVAVKLTGLSAERSVAAVVADEAFAKVRLYGLRDFVNWPAARLNPIAGNPNPNATYDFCDDFLFTANGNLNAGSDGFWGTGDDEFLWLGNDQIVGGGDDFLDDAQVFLNEFLYPSASVPPDDEYKYHWSALCRRAGDKDVQATIFITRRNVGGVNYYGYFYDGAIYTAVPTAVWPTPVPVNVEYDPTDTSTSTYLKELEIVIGAGSGNEDWNTLQTGEVLSFFDEGYTLVNNRDGKIYRILEMKDVDNDALHTRETIVLYEDWQWDGYPSNPPAVAQPETVWVIPPGVGSDRYPCVGVFQKVMHFEEIQ